MIILPEGFNYLTLLSDYWVFATPFITISMMFLARRLILRCFPK